MSKLYNKMSLDFRNVSSWILLNESKTEVVPVKFWGVAHKNKKKKQKKNNKIWRTRAFCDVQCPANSITHHFSKYISQ